MMKKLFALLTAIALLSVSNVSLAEQMPQGTPPAMPEGEMQGGERPDGTPPDMPNGQAPSGMMQGGPGGMGGMASAVTSYNAVTEITEDTTLSGGEYASTGTDENAILISSGTLTLTDSTVTRDSADSTGGDNASFYGVGAAVLATGGTVNIESCNIATTSSGGAGVFAYGDGVAYVSDSTITTTANTAGGIHVAGGGTLHASNLTVTTQGESSAAIRSDRGGGTMTVDGGTYTSNGLGSPAVYVTADITLANAVLTATGSEALCLEGLNTVRLSNCTLSGNMKDLSQNDNTWTVILYQSMSGDSQVGEGKFEMTDGTLISENGGLFYTTNTESEFVLTNVNITASDDCEYFLRATGNQNARGWGTTSQNGADCVFTAINQQMNGDVIWDSISTLTLNVTEGSLFTGAVIDDESCAGDGGSGYANVLIDTSSSWVVTGDSCVSALTCLGQMQDAGGSSVTVAGADGTVYVSGTSPYTVTVDSYLTE